MSLPSSVLQKIIFLRERGYSISEISRECNISKSTASRHANKIKILPEYYDRWLARRNAGKIISERNWRSASEKAEKLIECLTERDKILIAAVLYWAEGTKKDFNFINTDPEMISLFVDILRDVFGVKNEDFKITLRTYEDLDENSCLSYWSKVTGIDLIKEKTTINVLHGFKNGKLKYGMCRVRVKKGGLLHKEIFSIIKRINNISKIKSP